MEIQTVKLRQDGSYRVNDKWGVPNDPMNADYQLIQEWIAEGNTPEEADPPEE